MSQSLNGLATMADRIHLKSSELSCLIELIHEMDLDQDNDDTPAYNNKRNTGTLLSAVLLLSELVTDLTGDLASSLELEAEATSKEKRSRT